MHTCVSYKFSTQKATRNLLTNPHSYNPRFCPDPYCVCTQPSSIVNVYAATTGATVCPTAGAAVSEAGCQIVVESKTDSTCGTVVFNTAFCLPSSMASTASTSPSTQVQPQAAAPLTTAPVTTSVPSYTIVYVDQHRRRRVPEQELADGS